MVPLCSEVDPGGGGGAGPLPLEKPVSAPAAGYHENR